MALHLDLRYTSNSFFGGGESQLCSLDERTSTAHGWVSHDAIARLGSQRNPKDSNKCIRLPDAFLPHHAAWTCAATRMTMSFWSAQTRRVLITRSQEIAGIFRSS